MLHMIFQQHQRIFDANISLYFCLLLSLLKVLHRSDGHHFDLFTFTINLIHSILVKISSISDQDGTHANLAPFSSTGLKPYLKTSHRYTALYLNMIVSRYLCC
jgi:hypothetical protein